jgi:hypothetical protein
MFKTDFSQRKEQRLTSSALIQPNRRIAEAKKSITGLAIETVDPGEADGAAARAREDVEASNRSRSSQRTWLHGGTRHKNSIAEIKSSFPVNFHRKMIKKQKSGTETLANGTRPAKRRAHFSRTCGTEPRKTQQKRYNTSLIVNFALSSLIIFVKEK